MRIQNKVQKQGKISCKIYKYNLCADRQTERKKERTNQQFDLH